MIRYAIVDGSVTREALLRLRNEAVEYIQLRDKTLESGELATLAESLLETVEGTAAQVLIHSRVDVAIAVGAHGVHLPAHREQLTPAQVRTLYARVGMAAPVISISAHSRYELPEAREVDLILFAPVFEKRVADKLVTKGVGLEALTEICRVAAPTPVLALGGVTAANADECILAGAAGIAAIRMFA